MTEAPTVACASPELQASELQTAANISAMIARLATLQVTQSATMWSDTMTSQDLANLLVGLLQSLFWHASLQSSESLPLSFASAESAVEK